MAIQVCGKRAMGVGEEALMHQLENVYSIDFSVDIVMGSVWHFCPIYATQTRGRITHRPHRHLLAGPRARRRDGHVQPGDSDQQDRRLKCRCCNRLAMPPRVTSVASL